jgi:hypothetical protein
MNKTKLKNWLFEEHYNEIQLFAASLFLVTIFFSKEASTLFHIPIETVKLSGILIAALGVVYSISAIFARKKK